MNDSIILNNKPIFFCETCNYGCNHNSVFMKHQKSDKHLRHGEKKTFKCDKCNYNTNLKHLLLQHYETNLHKTGKIQRKIIKL